MYRPVTYSTWYVQLFKWGFHGNFHHVIARHTLIGMTSLGFSNQNWCLMLLWDRLDLGKFTRKFLQNNIEKKLLFEKLSWKFPNFNHLLMEDKTNTQTCSWCAQENSTPPGCYTPLSKPWGVQPLIGVEFSCTHLQKYV